MGGPDDPVPHTAQGLAPGQRPAASRIPVSDVRAREHGSALHVLLVEDDDTDAELVRVLLASMDLPREVSLVRTRTLADAMDLLQQASFELALLDLTLPDGSGLEVLEALRARHPDLPIIVVTGLVADRLPHETRMRGAHEFLAKGRVEADIFAASVRHALHTGQMEADRREEREQLEIALHAAQAGAWVLHVGSQVMQRDARASVLFGQEPVDMELDGAAFLTAVYEEDRDHVAAAWGVAAETGRDLEVEYRVVVDGAVRFITDRGRVVTHEDGSPTRISGISWDSTQRRRVEDANRRADKEESLATLAGGVAHDFNNLLVAILGHCAMAGHAVPSESAAREHMQQAVVAAERAAGLARQMLAYSGHGQLEMGLVDLNQLIEESRDLLAAAIDHRVVIETSLVEDLKPIMADGTQIQQVVMNLILNAADACLRSRDGKCIRIATELVDYAASTASTYAEFTRTSMPAGEYVLLRVSDDGDGIREPDRARMFDPFFSTKGAGRGLGLSAVLGVVRGHLGGIRVQQSARGGAEFQIAFPVASAESQPIHTAAREKPCPPLTAAHVLIVDDDDLVRSTCESMLTSLNASSICARDGREGVALFLQHHRDVDAVLLDLTMPGMSGEDVLRALRRIDAEVPIAIVSGYAEREVLGRFGEDAPDAFLQKPFRLSALGRVLHTLLPSSASAPG